MALLVCTYVYIFFFFPTRIKFGPNRTAVFQSAWRCWETETIFNIPRYVRVPGNARWEFRVCDCWNRCVEEVSRFFSLSGIFYRERMHSYRSPVNQLIINLFSFDCRAAVDLGFALTLRSLGVSKRKWGNEANFTKPPPLHPPYKYDAECKWFWEILFLEN